MNIKIRLAVVGAFVILAPVALFYTYLFEHFLDPSLPVIPVAAAALGLMSAGAAGYHVAELFADLDRAIDALSERETE